jgi:hypothetical protein
VHEDSARSSEVKESFKDSGANLRRSNILVSAGEDSSRGAHRGKKEKVEAFEHSKLFQVQKKSTKAQ